MIYHDKAGRGVSKKVILHEKRVEWESRPTLKKDDIICEQPFTFFYVTLVSNVNMLGTVL